MDCAEVERRLWEYLDDALPPEEAAMVRRHLGGCGSCAPACRCCRAMLVLVARVLRSQPGAPEPLRARLRIRFTADS
jgi:anti-sigma factor (TIGR02949 family)